ncbi:MAG: hypothetical protein SangKO_050080 [Sandaracinaceae bacterium]
MQTLLDTLGFLRIIAKKRLLPLATSLLALSACVVFTTAYFREVHRSIKRENEALEALIGREMEPNRDERLPVVAAAAMGAAELTDPCVARSGYAACSAIAALHEVGRSLSLAVILRQEHRGDDQHTPAAYMATLRHARARLLDLAPATRGLSEEWWTEWYEESAQALAAAEDGKAEIDECERPDFRLNAQDEQQSYERLYEGRYGSAGCDAGLTGRVSSLLIPSRLRLGHQQSPAAGCHAALRAAQPEPTTTQPTRATRPRRRSQPQAPTVLDRYPPGTCPAAYSDRVTADASFSSVLDVVLAPILRARAHDAGSSEEPALVQAYYISEDGLIRIWSATSDEPAYERFSGRRTWSASAYYNSLHLVQSPGVYGPSAPYLDYGAHGFVRTRCTAVRRRDSVVFGALCTDRTEPNLSLDRLPERLSENQGRARPFHVVWGTAILSHDQTVRVRIDAPDELVRAFADTLDLETHGAAASSILARRLQDTIRSSRAGFDRTFARVFSVSFDGEKAFIVPLRMTPDNGSKSAEFLFIRPRVREVPIGKLLAGGLAGIVWLILSGVLLVRSRTEATQRKEDAILQNLQVGVLSGPITGGTETEIDAANDRAEELLGIALPSFGARDNKPELFLQTVDPATILMAVRGPLNEPPTPLLYTESLRKMTEERRAGVSSEYYVRTLKTSPKRWLLVRGSPFIGHDSDSTGESVRTFAVIEPATWPTEELDRLVKKYEKHMK